MILKAVTVRDYMTRHVITFTPDMEIRRAISLLLEHRIAGAPVVDDHNNVVGILSEKDCMKIALHASYHEELGGDVSEFMSTEVQTVEAKTSIPEIAELFLNTEYRRFPVVEGNRLVGQISRRDVLRALQELW